MRSGVALVVVVILCLSAPTAAVADAVAPVGRDGIASCAREVRPGELTLQAPATGESTPTDLVMASPESIERSAGVDLGGLTDCPEVATGGGVTAIAGFARGADDNTLELRVATRSDSGAFAVPETVATVPLLDTVDASIAVGPHGEVVVGWYQVHSDLRDAKSARILAARRTAGPGAVWGSPEEVVPWREQDDFSKSPGVAAGMDGDGRATVAWTIGSGHRADFSDLYELGVATAGPGGPLAVTRLSSRIQGAADPVLAVAPTGQALLALAGDGTLRLFERPDGGARFARSAPTDRSVEGDPDQIAAAIDPSGGALVAWSFVDYSDEAKPRERLVAAQRPAGGRFGSPVSIHSRRTRDDRGSSEAEISIGLPGEYVPADSPAIRVKLGPDGRAAITWVDSRAVEDDSLPTGYVATTPGDGRYTVKPLGSPCRAVSAVTPFSSPGGDFLTAWTDNVTAFGYDDYEQPESHGRLHVAPAGATTSSGSAPRPPRLSIRAPDATQKLWASQPASLRVGCDAACDLRVYVPGRYTSLNIGGASLPRGGSTRIKLSGTVTRRAPRRLPIVVHACSPDGSTLMRATAHPRIVRRKALPVPPVLGLRATRTAGGNVIVTWRTPFPARRTVFVVAGRVGRSEASEDQKAYDHVEGHGHTRFSAVVRGGTGGALRWVSVSPYSLDGTRSPRVFDVRVGS